MWTVAGGVWAGETLVMPRRKPTKDATIRRLRGARMAAGFTQAQAAAAIGKERLVVSLLENGKRKLTALEAADFCHLYRVTPDWLLGFRESEDLREIAGMYCETLPIEVREALHKFPDINKQHQCGVSS